MEITQKTGNLIKLALQGKVHAIAHGANCFHAMGAGIAKVIAQTWPQALEVDKTQTNKGDKSKLGNFSHCITQEGLLIANLYTQWRWGKASYAMDSKDARQGYIAQAIGELCQQIPALLPKAQEPIVAIPLIGAGLAGGDWNQILPAIEANPHVQNAQGELRVVVLE